MRRARILVIPVLVALFLVFVAGFAPAQEARQVTTSDAGSPVAGKTVVTEYTGDHSAANSGGRAISVMPGWPQTMGMASSFAPSRGMVFEDLDGDGTLEVITSSTDKKIYAWDYTGTLMPGFPVNTIEMAQYAPTVGDLDGDGDMEIVQFTRGLTKGGRLYILDHQGSVLPGFPKSVNNNNISSCPCLHDLDNDGDLEILAAERAYPIGYLHVFEYDGTEWGGRWPVALDHVPACTPGVADVDNDGLPEIAHCSYNSLYLIETDGNIMAGWPKQIANANFSYQSPAFADLDGDSDLEILVGAHKNAAGCYVFHHDGTGFPGWPKMYGTWSYCPPTVTDLEGDGSLEILGGRAGYGPGVPSNCFWAWTTAGITKPGFPYSQSHGGGTDGPITIADVNNDGFMEIFTDHNIMDSGQGYLFGVDAFGNDLPGFPLRPLGFTYLNGATIGDVDGDGDYELGVLAYDSVASVYLYDLDGTYHPSDVAWETYHKKNERGGRYQSEDRLHIQGYWGLGSTVNFYLHDGPGYKAYLFMSVGTMKILHPSLGWLYLSFSPFFYRLVSNVTLPPSGEYKLPLLIPNDPMLSGATLYFQGATGPDPALGFGSMTNMLGRTIQ